MTHSSVTIQITPQSQPATPSWMGEVAAFAQVLTHTGLLQTIQEQVRFARARSKHGGGPAHRLSQEILARQPFPSPGGLVDPTGRQWMVIDVDGTRQAARQRALPQTDVLPTPHRRFDQVCAPGYTGRKRGEVVRTRTVILQTHTHQFLGTFGAPGNGDYRGELQRAIGVLKSYATHHGLPAASILVRLDGLYGDAAPLLDVLSAHLSVVARSRAYHLLDREVVQQRLGYAPDQVSIHAESGMTRALYDCAAIPLTATGPVVRLVIAPTLPEIQILLWASSTTEWSKSCLSVRFPLPPLRPRMFWISIYTVGHLKPCWPTKTRSKSRIAGTRIPRGVRNLLKSWPSGYGTFD